MTGYSPNKLVVLRRTLPKNLLLAKQHDYYKAGPIDVNLELAYLVSLVGINMALS
jgi:hypothetical protein